MMRWNILISMTLLFANGWTVFAQQDSTREAQIYKVVLNDGSELIGRIQSADSSTIHFVTVSMITLEIPRGQLRSIVRLSGTIRSGEFLQSDPNDSRLFFAATGRPLRNGQGYLSIAEIFFPLVALGIGDVVTVAGGISFFPGAETQLVYFAPKVTPVRLKDLDVSAGALYINATTGGATGIGILYGVGTFGTSDRAVTAGLGWGFSFGEVANKPIVLIGGEYRISRSIKLITENWFPPDIDLVIYSFGIRFFGERLAADLGFIRPSKFTSQGFPFIPWVGFAYNFGKQ